MGNNSCFNQPHWKNFISNRVESSEVSSKENNQHYTKHSFVYPSTNTNIKTPKWCYCLQVTSLKPEQSSEMLCK